VIAEPTRTLAPQARWIWRGQQALGWGIATLVAFMALRQIDGTLSLVAGLVALAGLVVGVTVVPGLRWRRWRWEVRPDAIDIRHGTFVVRRTLIPMPRVQHVDTTQDVVEQQLGLANVVVHTAAGNHRIPLLLSSDAGELRERIGELALNADEP
jgi:membrane protein YdbS with pleckstrin-like domain